GFRSAPGAKTDALGGVGCRRPARHPDPGVAPALGDDMGVRVRGPGGACAGAAALAPATIQAPDSATDARQVRNDWLVVDCQGCEISSCRCRSYLTLAYRSSLGRTAGQLPL